jgi:CheY-like chemotaxis protein
MPILNGFEATKEIRALEKVSVVTNRKSAQLNGRIPIFAVSASLQERQQNEMTGLGLDGWILKPINFKRLRIILDVILDPDKRKDLTYKPGCSWEAGGWFDMPEPLTLHSDS